MDQNYQLKLALLRKAAVAADAVVKSHTPGTVPSATSEQMKLAKTYMVMAVPGFILHLFDEIDRLKAVETSVIDMAAMLGNREWAEHAGKGVAADLERQITTLHNELSEKQDDAERFAFFAHVAVNDELHDVLQPHMPADAKQPETIEGVRAHMDLCIQAAKDAGFWPIKAAQEIQP